MPKYTIIEYRTDHGPISAVTLTSVPDRIVFGFTDRKACEEFLRRKRVRSYILNGETHQLEPLPQHTDRYRRCKAWLEEFMERTPKSFPKTNEPLLFIETSYEVDHCNIRKEWTLHAEYKDNKPVFILHHYDEWYGSSVHRTDGTPEELIRVTEFLQEHSEEILQNLEFHKK